MSIRVSQQTRKFSGCAGNDIRLKGLTELCDGRLWRATAINDQAGLGQLCSYAHWLIEYCLPHDWFMAALVDKPISYQLPPPHCSPPIQLPHFCKITEQGGGNASNLIH